MLYKVLFVEHDAAHIARFAAYLPVEIEDACFRAEVAALISSKKSAQSTRWTPPNTQVVVVAHPSQVASVLDETFDLIITDCLFDHELVRGKEVLEPAGPEGIAIKVLFEAVKQVSAAKLQGRSVPVILYTQMGSAVMPIVREFEHAILDVWDKATSSEFLAWRLHTLPYRVPCSTPGRSLARLISTLEDESWEVAHVRRMATDYMRSASEQDQIEAVTTPLRQIASNSGIQEPVDKMWKVFIEWEPLDRAASLAKRAHVRHAINVFWMGYFLLNAKGLRGLLDRVAETLVRGSGSTKKWDQVALANVAWFLCGMFHDVGQPGLGVSEILSQQSNAWKHVLRSASDELDKAKTSFTNVIAACRTSCQEKVNDAVKHADEKPAFSGSGAGAMLRYLARYLSERTLIGKDHGLLGACIMLEQLSLTSRADDEARSAATGACIAIAAHNLVGKPDEPKVSWREAPLICLLVLCDQLQAWDREVEETAKKGRWRSLPTHAELRELSVLDAVGGTPPRVRMSIDYKAPGEIARDVTRLNDMKAELCAVLLDYPVKALKEGLTDWFFGLEVAFTLEGQDLSVPIRISAPSVKA